MKLLAGISLCCLLVGNAAAQRAGGRGVGGGAFRGVGRVFPSRVGSFPRTAGRFARFNQRFGNGNFGGGFFGGGFDTDSGYPIDFGYDPIKGSPNMDLGKPGRNPWSPPARFFTGRGVADPVLPDHAAPLQVGRASRADPTGRGPVRHS